MRRTFALGLLAILALAGCTTTTQTGGPSAGGTPSAGPVASTPPAPANTLTVTSDAFTDGGQIPASYTCTGQGLTPTIMWSGDLRGAAAIAVVVDDPDAPSGTFVHRVVVDLPASATSLGADPPAGAHQARNSAGRNGWTAPCPPSGTHHYRFTVYGLSAATGLADGVPAAQAQAAIAARAVVQGRLVGLVSH
jgi:Raf kinase inhibitor-like YbhB/YbcL family protein